MNPRFDLPTTRAYVIQASATLERIADRERIGPLTAIDIQCRRTLLNALATIRDGEAFLMRISTP